MRDFVGGDVAATCCSVVGGFAVDVAEVMAMRNALIIAMESGCSKVCLETDNLTLYHKVKKGAADSTDFGMIIKDIIQLGYSCQYISYAFFKRNGNQVAHILAKISRAYDNPRVWLEEYPPEVHDAVMTDV